MRLTLDRDGSATTIFISLLSSSLLVPSLRYPLTAFAFYLLPLAAALYTSLLRARVLPRSIPFLLVWDASLRQNKEHIHDMLSLYVSGLLGYHGSACM